MSDILAVRNELECPVCMEFMVEEIFLCVNGHSICKSCIEKVQVSCPICRGLFADRRNYTLEKIASVLTYPCRTCKEEFKASEVMTHELNCDPGTFTCNTFFTNCKWSGAYLDAKTHIEEHHQQNIQKWNAIGNYQLYILFYEEQPFFVFFKISGELSYYSAVFIGPKKNVKKYICNVEFEDQTGLRYKLYGACPCIPLCRLGQVFDREKITFSYNMMENFLGNRSSFASNITINK